MSDGYPDKLDAIMIIGMVAIAGILGFKIGADSLKASPDDFVRYNVKLYSGGVCVREWTDVRRFDDKASEGRFFFNDSSSGNPVEISGEVVVEKFDMAGKRDEAAVGR